MLTHRLVRLSGAVALVLFLRGSMAGAGAVVYDNTTTPTTGSYTPAGFWPFSVYTPNEFMGDSITLAGSQRTIDQFVLVVSSSEPTVLDSITLRFYSLDGPWPDTQIWQGTVSDVAISGITEVPFDVPDVMVGDSFVWAASADSMVAGLATFDPPTVGSSDDYWFDLDPSDLQWRPFNFEGDPVANFGARVTAVPEPATAAVLLLGGLAAFLGKSRPPARI